MRQATRRLSSSLFVTSLLLIAMIHLQPVTANAQPVQVKAPRPNIIVIFTDDMGYGDIGCFGHPTIATPNLDRMAAQGQKWTQFYVPESVCTPSRAGLLTGRYPVRSGMASDKRRVLFPNSGGGMPASEITIPELLKTTGYATHAIGKWHLGHLPQFLPTEHGFDTYFGIPYSNDMDRVPTAPRNALNRDDPDFKWWNVPLIRNKEVIEQPADQNTITRRYTDEAIKVIREKKEKPFFIYLAHNLPHVPLFASPEMRGKSQRGFYGDVIQEIDHEVGRILNTLAEAKLDQQTLVIFTSDNGPWLPFGIYGGSAGLLQEGKGTTWEGGHRVPTIFHWPGTIKPAVITGIGSTLDLLPTFATLAGGKAPGDRKIDGHDLSTVIQQGKPSPRESMIYYRGESVYAARLGAWKAHFIQQGSYGSEPKARVTLTTAKLYNLDIDPGEKHDLATQHPEKITEIQKMVEAHRTTIEPVTNQLEIPPAKD